MFVLTLAAGFGLSCGGHLAGVEPIEDADDETPEVFVDTGLRDVIVDVATDSPDEGDSAPSTRWTVHLPPIECSCEPVDAVWGAGTLDVWFASQSGGTSPPIEGYIHNPFRGISQRLGGGFSDIWGSSTTDVWFPSIPRSYHFNGAKFVEETGAVGSAVWGTSADDVWIVGWSPGLLAYQVYHRTAAGWASVTGLPDSTIFPLDVWTPAPNDVWIVGQKDAVVHWDGTAWKSRATGWT